MKAVIAGGRDFTDYDTVKQWCDHFFQNYSKPTITIVSGRCSIGTPTFTTESGIIVYGADGLGELYARENGMPVLPYPASWNLFGKSAGSIRNRQMGIISDCVMVFWDGKSKGASNMIDIAREMNLKLRIIRYGTKDNQIFQKP